MTAPNRPRLELVTGRRADDAPDLPLDEDRHDELEPRPDQDVEEVVYEGEIVSEQPERTRLLPSVVVDRVMVVRPSPGAKKAALVTARHGAIVLAGWHSWLVRMFSGLTDGVIRERIRAAKALGDDEKLAFWLDKRKEAKRDRRDRLMELPLLVLRMAAFVGMSVAGFLVLMVVVATVVWMTGAGDWTDVWVWLGGVIRWLFTAVTFAGWVFVFAWPVWLIAWGWLEGNRQPTTGPKWLATSAELDVDVRIDEVTITTALAALRIPAITAYLKQKLPLQFLVSARKDGRGTYAEVRLPTGVPAEWISKPAKRAALAAGLYRATKEVWPTTGSEAGILKLWIADKGALAEGAGPYPLLDKGFVDVFKGVPYGKTLRGDPMVAPVIGRNTIVGGMPEQGKSSAGRVIMAGASLDITVELRIWVPDANYDFEVFKQRCSRYVMGAEDEKIEQILYDLRELDGEVQTRGDLLVEHREPEVTRELANAGVGLHPVVGLLEEAHVAFQHKEYGEEIAELATSIVKLGRKRGIHLIVSTQAPTRDSIPRDITRNCSNGIAFAVGDHVANDALLGQGAYRGGHRATELIPGVDRGTALVKGFSGQRSEMVQAYFLSVAKGNDQVTPLIERSLAEIKRRGMGVPGRCRPAPAPERRELLEDVAAVMGDEPIKAADLPALLARHAPTWQPYKTLTGKQLVEDLAALGVKVPSTGNRWLVDPEVVRAALAQRQSDDGEAG
ncbi:FtsK/SpoIIIE domain-containing protein [Nonomuraea turcica]|uniref:hypothetical protein n=1 Tax=Nonomuraea sp. G32 TaxID=3067274 RepID=UPI00273C8587|nr:hypothetical protein [Nonomuraea sp. G32]MDP4501119.1 hypothetical protein [Nonomuraea sp. G32]